MNTIIKRNFIAFFTIGLFVNYELRRNERISIKDCRRLRHAVYVAPDRRE